MNLISRSRRFVSQLKLGAAAKPVIGVLGGSVVLVGIAMLALPGPAFLVIPLGLAILATQFPWARRWLQKARGWLPKGTKRSAGHWPRFQLIPHRRYLAILGVLFAIWWIALGIAPVD